MSSTPWFWSFLHLQQASSVLSKIGPSFVKPKIFVVFGMPRCGTTYLYHALPQHPDIFVPYRKESHYFSVNYSKGAEWFSSLFSAIADEQIGADINPMYYLDPMADARILEFDPEIQVVLGIRAPVDFAISLYGNMHAHGHNVPPITDVVRDYDWPLTPHSNLRFSLGSNYFSNRISDLCAKFGDHLLLYDFKYFSASPLPVLQAIERFLGIPAHFNHDNVIQTRINASGRRNLVFLTSLLSDQRILDVIYAVLPDPVIRRARSLFDRLSARSGKQESHDKASSTVVSEAEREYLEEFFADDSTFYATLFCEHPLVLGSGESATLH